MRWIDTSTSTQQGCLFFVYLVLWNRVHCFFIIYFHFLYGCSTFENIWKYFKHQFYWVHAMKKNIKIFDWKFYKNKLEIKWERKKYIFFIPILNTVIAGQKCCVHIHGVFPYIILKTGIPFTGHLENKIRRILFALVDAKNSKISYGFRSAIHAIIPLETKYLSYSLTVWICRGP